MDARRTVATMFCAFACGFVLTAAPGLAMSAPIQLSDESNVYDVNGNADVLDDPGGNLDIDDVVRSRRFHRTSQDDQPPVGAVRWYRFRASAPDSSHPRWYIFGGRAIVSLDLYEPRADGGFSHVAFGYNVPFADRQAPGRNPAALIHRLSGPLFVRARAEKYPQFLFLATAGSLEDGFINGPGYPSSVAMLVLAIAVAGLGAITRARSFWLLAAVGLSAAATFALPSELPMWLPHLSPPPVWMIVIATFSAYFIAQAAFYYRYLGVAGLRNPWLNYGYLGLTVLVLLVDISLWAFSSNGPPVDLGQAWFYRLESLWFIGITALACAQAVRGNRAAWLVVPGSLLFAATTYGYFYLLAGFEQSTDLVWQAFVYCVPFNMLMMIFGVGVQVRQAATENERLLRERDTVHDQLIGEQQHHIADVERRNATFSRFMPREFLAQLEKDDVTDVRLGDHVERKMAIVFADIRGFTALSERLSSEATFQLLNAYLARVGPIIRINGGFIDKYIGDGILALFPDGPTGALDAAIALQTEVRRFNDERSRQGHEPITVGIGINFGDMLMGTIGEAERYETTVIADTVNIAARLEGLTKMFGVSIIASQAVVDALPNREAYCLRPLGHVSLRGHEESMTAFEVFDGDAYDAILRKRKTLDAFRRAVAALENGEYSDSAQAFEAIAAIDTEDAAAAFLRDRSRTLISQE